MLVSEVRSATKWWLPGVKCDSAEGTAIVPRSSGICTNWHCWTSAPGWIVSLISNWTSGRPDRPVSACDELDEFGELHEARIGRATASETPACLLDIVARYIASAKRSIGDLPLDALGLF
jgi:hypothetical protein